ncbi:hypothetical protein FOWG_17309 [Fusarium oxysporum f. sp. lycopersici MN25]|nr:hypothetical protein FOWG_17309 [Fusarium oxysporum f. sp. lycopersici MN25]
MRDLVESATRTKRYEVYQRSSSKSSCEVRAIFHINDKQAYIGVDINNDQ